MKKEVTEVHKNGVCGTGDSINHDAVFLKKNGKQCSSKTRNPKMKNSNKIPATMEPNKMR